MTEPTVVLRVLGPLRVEVGGEPLPLGGLKQRAILALLLTSAGRAVSIPLLLEALWEDGVSDNAASTLQVHVSGLRRSLAAGGSTAPRIELQGGGYRLSAPGAVVDLEQFRALRRRAIAAAKVPAEAARLNLEALSWWQGAALADLTAIRALCDVAVGLDEDRLIALEQRIEADLACGQHSEVVGELRQLVAEHPLRERFSEQLILALYRSGRQADALAAFAAVRRLLLDELGVDPGPGLRKLEAAVLAQDRSLAWSPPAEAVRIVDETLRGDSAAPPPASLLAADGSRTALVTGRIVIGRHPECSLVVPDAKVSRRHADITATPDGWVLTDLGSSNGTYINDVLCRRQALVTGDVITVGSSSLTFVYDDLPTNDSAH